MSHNESKLTLYTLLADITVEKGKNCHMLLEREWGIHLVVYYAAGLLKGIQSHRLDNLSKNNEEFIVRETEKHITPMFWTRWVNMEGWTQS